MWIRVEGGGGQPMWIIFKLYNIFMHPAQPSKARLGGVHSYFSAEFIHKLHI